MPFARLFSAAFIGLEAILIEVEIDLTEKPGAMRLVGLPDAAVKESKDRVLQAVKNSGFSTESFSCIVHLAPAEIKKAGAFYDLPIALGILQGVGAFRSSIMEDYLIGGEVGLMGEIRPIFGALSLALLAKKLGKKGVILPRVNAAEAALVAGLQIIPLQSLKEGITFFKEGRVPPYSASPLVFKARSGSVDMRDVKGQAHAKRALEIAAAGTHNVLMCGPPGTGKTMLAKAFIGILPPLTFEEVLEVANIYSLAGNGGELMHLRPFRAPHHTISFVGMVGGGAHPKPGEISLAHKGVLFLDEFPEFNRSVLECLRQPLEDKEITVSRAGGKATFPTDVICIAAMNPCPCGYLGHPEKPCKDTQKQIDRYRSKISGPLVDRIAMHLDVAPVSFQELANSSKEESSEEIRARVQTARERFKKEAPDTSLNEGCQSLMKEAMDVMGISARGHRRILRVAQTIACLAGKSSIEEDHLLEALSYQPKA